MTNTRPNHNQLVLLFLALLFCSAELQAQATTTFTLKGTVLDSQQQPIEVGNLLVLNPSDSSLIKGTYIMEGNFELEGLSSPAFLVQLTAYNFGKLKASGLRDRSVNGAEMDRIK